LEVIKTKVADEQQYFTDYVSSTESYLVNEMDGMIEDIDKYHPFG
jgi:hypothetical protein